MHHPIHAADPTLDRIVRSLADDHAAHTILLYGSRADGSAGPDSDYDIAAFAPVAEPFRIARPEPGGYLDVWVYREDQIEITDGEFLKLRGSRILRQRGTEADDLMRALEARYARGPDPLDADEIAARRVWAHKMVERMQRGDAEGDYRRAWLLYTLLEDYFHLRGLWCEGPKKALRWLARFDAGTHDAFVIALRPGANDAAIRALVDRVAGPVGA